MARLKACSVCGKIHDASIKCKRPVERTDAQAYTLRQTNKWHNKSLEIRERSQWLCAVCKAQGIINYEKLSVHHITKLSENPDGLLDDENLVCLCANHHLMADDGLIDADYLRELAKQRDNLL